MQLSTRTTDYIVDTLELREHMYLFNEVFTDPKIIKVSHIPNMKVVNDF